jgi:hypothetical protein
MAADAMQKPWPIAWRDTRAISLGIVATSQDYWWRARVYIRALAAARQCATDIST